MSCRSNQNRYTLVGANCLRSLPLSGRRRCSRYSNEHTDGYSVAVKTDTPTGRGLSVISICDDEDFQGDDDEVDTATGTAPT